MKPLLTPTGPDAPTALSGSAETEVSRTRARPPKRVQALRLVLLAATVAVCATWLDAWEGVQAYAWPGIDNGLTERGLSYLLILAPGVPVNLLAAISLARGGRRAQHYLAAAGTIAVVQIVLLLTPSAMPLADTMSDGATSVCFRHLVISGPTLVLGIWIVATTKTREWLGATPKPRRRLFVLEAAVWCLAIACVFTMGTEVRQWTHAAVEPLAPSGEYTEPGTWAALERAVTETTDAIPDFAGFTTRTLDVVSCDYYTPAGLPTYRYELTYELNDSAAEPSAAAPIATRWTEGDFQLTYDGETLEGTRRITAEHAFPTTDGTYPTATGLHALTLEYTEAGTPALHLESPCVERAAEPTECILPQGNPTKDTINGITCRD
jgi:hypothetical protein